MEPTSVLVSMIESGHEFGDLAQRLRVGVTQKGVATRTAQFLCLITLCETETALYHSDGRNRLSSESNDQAVKLLSPLSGGTAIAHVGS